jgi:hypothetical protein
VTILTPAWLASAERGDLRVLKRMYGAESALLDACGVGTYWTGHARALHFAAYRGHHRVLRWLLERVCMANR